MTRPVLVGTYDGALTPEVSGVEVVGLERESTYLWGLFRSRGEHPDIYSTLRRLSPTRAWPARLLVQSNREATGIRKIEMRSAAARSAEVASTMDGADQRHVVAGIDDAESFEFALVDDTVRWTEGDILSLDGREVGPGLQWSLPVDVGGDGIRYASRIFRVSGTIEGVAIDGFVGCDQVHLAPGRQNYVDDPLTASHLSNAWCTWACEYDDGSIEAGHTAFGRDGFGFGLRSTNSRSVTTTEVAGDVTGVERGCPTQITVQVDGESWEFVADERGLPLEPLPGPVRQAEGWFGRVGETRRPVVWCATPEVPAP